MELISVENLIKSLKQKNINFGKGDPYNRLRYYTKIGWLPHMTRKKNEEGNITGHYPISVIDEIIRIEELKNLGLNNEEISIKIKKYNQSKFNFEGFINYLKKININIIFILVIGIAFFLEISRVNSLYENLNLSLNSKPLPIVTEKRIEDYGISFIPKYQNEIFVPSSKVTPTSIILLTMFNNLGYNNSYFIREVKEGQGFYIQTTYPVTNEIKFNWVLIK